MVRRIVTANNEQGRSYIAIDETTDERTVWRTSGGNPLEPDSDDRPSIVLPSTAPAIEPPAGGGKCSFVAIQPWKLRQAEIARGDYPGLDPQGFHRTATLDYIMLTEGEVTLMLDIGETVVRAGDLVVQRNTNHSWRVHGDTPAKLWGIMISLAE
jgi:hypothetical protein